MAKEQEDKATSILERGKALVEREVIATQTQNLIIVDDGSNEATIPGFPYRFLAQGDKILVSVDIFKSGYECKECKGVGRIKSHCSCEDSFRPGYRYSFVGIDAEGVYSEAQKQMKCKECGGDYIEKRVDEVCKACNGTGALLHIPDTGKMMPTTGVIVSVGSEVKNPLLKNQTRVLFGAYTGVMIPTKAPGIVFKVLRDIEVLCIIKGGEEMAAFDFILADKDLN
jgi:hypothetical protein